jgi:reactive intermediate/imine deaminase
MSGKIVKVSRNTANAPIDPASSQTVAFSHYNNISAQLPLNPQSGRIVDGDVRAQANRCLTNIDAIVRSVDHTMDDVVKTTVFLKDISDVEAVNDAYAAFFNDDLPTRTVVAVADLPLSGALVQIDAVVSNGEGTPPQDALDLVKVSRNTPTAPIDPASSQTVAFSHYNNLSAQLPLDPHSGQMVDGDVRAQANQCLTNIKAILKSINHTMDDVVKTTIFLTDISDTEAVNDVCAEFFPGYVPSRTVVNASALPSDALVQIDTVVAHGDGTPPQLPEDAKLLVIEASNTVEAPAAPYAHTVAFSHYNHISGQLPVDPATGQIVTGGIEEQVGQCLTNIEAIVESVDHVIDDVVKLNVQVKSMSDIAAVNDVCATFFEGDLPAGTTVGVSAIPLGALVQIDAVVSNAEGTPPQT